MMSMTALIHTRLSNQLISEPTTRGPADAVRQLGFVQAQDYLGALWAVGLRTKGATETDVEKALASGSILRTWPARGTLHFVAAEDAHWLLDLLTPRVITKTAGRYRQLGLDKSDFERSKQALVHALQGGNRLKREEMYKVMDSAGILTAGQRGIHILGRLAMEGVICFGPRDGKQQTFVLLDEWVPRAKKMDRDQSQAELARRYFTSHGPASLSDFTWWSGQTAADARAGLALAEPHLAQETIQGQVYWGPKSPGKVETRRPQACLLPPFDEYLVGYKDRGAVLDPAHMKQVNAGGGMLSASIVMDGQVLGTWKRTLKKGTVIIKPQWFSQVTEAQQEIFQRAAHQYAAFLDLNAVSS